MANGGDIKFRVGFQTQTQSLTKLKTSLQELQKIKPGPDFSGTLTDLREIDDTAKKVENALDKAFNVKLGSLNISGFKQQLDKTGLSLDKIYSTFSKAGTQGKAAFNQMANQVLTTNLQLKQTSHLIQDIGDTMAKTVKWGIASSVMNNFTNSVKSAFTYVKALDTSLTDIRIVTGDSTEQMAEFARQANRAAQALGRSTMDYTKSALTFYQQGLDPETVATRTQAVLKAQNITGAGTQMADYLTSVWNGYKVANEQAQLYVDKLAAVADSSASNMSQLAIAMSKVAATANVMGVDVDQLASMLATVVATTRQAPESVGTAFKTILTRLNDIKTGAEDAETTLGNYSKQMASLGFNVLDASGKLRDTGEVMEEIGSSWANLTKQQQVYLARTMGGQRQITQVMALFDNWNTYTKLLNISLESEGTLMEKNGRYMDSMAAKMEKLGAATERIKDSLMNEDDLKGLIDGLTSVTSLVGSFVDSIGGGRGVLLGLGSIFTQVFSGTIAKELAGAITNFQNLRSNAEQIRQEIASTAAFRQIASSDRNNQVLGNLAQKTQESQRYYSIMTTEEINLQKEKIRTLTIDSQQLLSWKQKEDAAKSFARSVKADQKDLENIYSEDYTIHQQLNSLLDDMQKKIKSSKEAAKDDGSNTYIDDLKQDAEYFIGILKETDLGGKTEYAQLEQALNAVKNLGPEARNSSQEVKNLNLALANIGTITQKEIDKAKAALKDGGKSIETLGQKVKQTSGQIDGINKERELTFKIKNFTNIISSFGQIASSINNVINLTQIWEDDTLSSTEKIRQTLTNLSMTIPMLLNSVLTLGGALANLGGGIAKGATLAQAATVVFKGLGVAFSQLILPIAGVVAVVALVTTGIKALTNIWNKEAKAAQKAAQTAEKAKKSYEDLKQAQDNLVSSFDKYHQLQDTIQGLTEGQKDWKKAIQDSNNAVLDLIKTYPELAESVQRVNGQLKISEEGQKRLLDLQQRRVASAKNVSNLLDIAANQAEFRKQAVQITRSAGYTQVNDPYYVQNIIKYLKENNISEGQLDNINQLATKISQQTGASKDVVAAILQHASPDILQLSDKIDANAQVTQKLYQVMANASGMQGYENYSDAQKAVAERYATGVYGNTVENTAKAIREAFTEEVLYYNASDNQKKLIETFQNVTGKLVSKVNKDTVVTNNGEYSFDQFVAAIANEIAIKQVDRSSADLNNVFTRIQSRSVTKQQANAATEFLGSGQISGKDMTFAELRTLLDKYQEENFSGIFTDPNKEYLKIFGKSAEDFNKDYNQYLENYSKDFANNLRILTPAIKDAYNNLNKVELNSDKLTDQQKASLVEAVSQRFTNDTGYSLPDMSFDQLKNTGLITFIDILNAQLQEYSNLGGITIQQTQSLLDNLEKAYIQGGKQAVENLRSLYSNVNDFAAFQELISGYNQQQMSVETLIAKMEQAGIATDITAEALQEYIKWKRQQAQAIVAPEEAYKAIHDIIDKLKDESTITSQQADALKQYGINVEDYFTRLADGTFKLEGKVKDFYNYANGVSLEPLKQQIQALRKTTITGQEFISSSYSRSSGGNFEDFSQEAVQYEDADTGSGMSARTDLLSAQLDFLVAVNEQSTQFTAIQEKILNKTGLIGRDYETLAELVKNHYDQWVLIEGQVAANAQQLKIYEQQLANIDLTPPHVLDADIDQDIWKNLSDHISNYAEAMQGVSKDLQDNIQDSEDLAQAILRYDSALESVLDNYDEWLDMLSSDSVQEHIQATNELRNVYADLLDFTSDGMSLSDDFLGSVENLQLLQQAAQGSQEAYQQLLDLAGQDIALQLGIDTNKFQEDKLTIQNSIADLLNTPFDDIEIGTKIQDQALLDQMSNIINAAKMTADQATDYLASMGVDAQIVEANAPTTETKQQVGWTSTLVPNSAEGQIPIVSGVGNKTLVTTQRIPYTTYSTKYEPVTETTTTTSQNKAVSLKVKSAKKSSGGGFKFSQASHGGGSRGTAARAPKSSGGGGGGKGGGSGKQPNQMKGQNHTIDRYHDINNQLKRLSTQYEKISDAQKDLTGQNLINNLNKQLDILQDQIAAHQVKLDIEKDQAKELQEALKAEGALFDDNTGALTNYAQLLSNKLNSLNATIDYYNSLSAQQQQTYKDTVEQAKEDYKDLEQTIKRYDDLLFNEIPEQQKAIKDALDKQIDIQIQKFKTKVEVDLDLSDAIKDWNKFKKTVIDQIRDDDVVNNAIARLDDLFAYYNNLNSGGLVKSLTDQIKDTLKQLEEIDTTGDSSIYGERKAEALKDLKDYADKLMDSLQDVQDVLKDVKESFFDMVDAAQDAFDEQSDEYESLSDLLEHSKDTIQLLYGDQAFDKLAQYLDKQKDIDRRELEFERQQKQFWWDQMQAQKAIMDAYDKESNAYKEAEQRFKQLQKHWLDGIKEFNDKIQQSIENLMNSYNNTVNQIFQGLNDKLSSGKGLDFLSEEWELMNDNADRYLDKINSMYEISKLEQAYEDALKDYDGDIAAQTSLNDLMEQQLKLLRDKDRLSQYDVDRANLLLQIELKRLALQQARASKTKLRLRRDSQGNYTYQYTADEEQLSQAQKALAEAQNSLYNLDKNQYKSNLNDIYSLQTEFNDKMKQLYNEYPIWTEQAQAKRKLLIEYYEDAINGVVADNNDIRTNLTQSAFDELANLYQTDVENFKAMSAAEQEELLGNLIPQWKSGIQQMANVITGEGGFVPACEQAFDDLKDVTQSYMDDLGTLQQVADVNFDQLGENIDLTIERTQSLIEQNQDLINSYYSEMAAIMGIITELNDLTTAYSNAKNEAINATKAAYDYWQQQKEIQAAKSQVPYTPIATTPTVSKANPNTAVATTASTVANSVGSALSNIGSILNDGISAASDIITNLAKKINEKTPKAATGAGGGVGVTFNRVARYATGGYTGDWGSDGRIGILDEKQLVLNRTDTERILSAVNIVRTMDDLLASVKNSDITMSNIITGMSSGNTTNNSNQNVYITADFPNVESRTEIEAAFNNLINRASQYVGINRK